MRPKPSEIQRAIMDRALKDPTNMSEEEIQAALVKGLEDVRREFERLGITGQDIVREVEEHFLELAGSQEEYDRQKLIQAALPPLSKETDRSVAITWAAIVEDELAAAIRRHLSTDDAFRGLLSRTMEPQGVLGNFGSKITFGALLSIFGPDVWREMKAIRDIRNLFAHRLDIDNFDHKEVSKHCAKLRIIEKFIVFEDRKPGITRPTNSGISVTGYYLEGHDLIDSNRGRFISTSRLLWEAIADTHAGTKNPVLHPDRDLGRIISK